MVKIALLSDIHFGKDARCSDFAIPGQQIPDEVVGGKPLLFDLEAKLTEYKPDYIFCAGDLTSSGKPLEYKYCLETIYAIAEKACVPKHNVIYCIGNHDVDWSIIAHSSNKDEYVYFTRDFNSDETTFLNSYYSGISHSWLHNTPYIDEVESYCRLFSSVGPIPMTGIIDRDDLTIFVLNSGFLCSTEQEIIHGKISDKQFEWFERELKAYNNSKKWKVVLLHHHPFNFKYLIRCPEYSTLEEGPQLQELCGKYGVNLVLHGHYHFPRAETQRKSGWNNPVTFISAGSLCVNQTGRLGGQIPNTFHYVQLEEYPNWIKLITYEYSFGDGWSDALNNRDALPLDHEMYFGELSISDDEAKTIIADLPTGHPISYNDIDPKLKYLSPSHLNELLQEVHGLNLSGSFPGYIQLHNSAGGKNNE